MILGKISENIDTTCKRPMKGPKGIKEVTNNCFACVKKLEAIQIKN
jgi:hypothetical protein